MEPRRLLAADPLRVGVVYVEEDVGSDLHGDTFEVTFEGGAAGTELTRLVISGDQHEPGFGERDVLFDTAPTGHGTDASFPFQIISLTSQAPQAAVNATVSDGGTELVLEFVGFRAGDKLVFQIDVDEVEDFDPFETDLSRINEGLDPLTSGVEFQGSRLTASFSAPHYHDVSESGEFRNRYDERLDPLQLDLRRDDDGGKRDRTAGVGIELVQEPLPVSISGRVYLDSNLDLAQGAGEPGLSGVGVSLYQKEGSEFVFTGHSTTTNAAGDYRFGVELDLKPGTYQVRQSQPTGLFSVGAISGTVAGAATNSVVAGNRDVLSEIVIPLGDLHAIDYDFAEAQPAAIAGFVYHDRNDDGVRGAAEEGLGGVTVQVIGVDTIVPQAIVTLTTAPDGSYSATGLAPGHYRIVEATQPTGYFDRRDKAGTVNGVAVGAAVNPGDNIEAIFLGGGQSGVEYNFGEIAPASIRGLVQRTGPDGDCFGPGSTPLTGVTLRLLDANNNLVATTQTNADGEYEFRDLLPGRYSVVEVTPADLLDGDEHVGSINGVAVGQVEADDVISGIVLASGNAAVEYNFCEHAPASLSGFVYHDADNNGLFDVGEEAIGQVVVTLQDQGGNPVASTATGLDGSYHFTRLRAGTYTLAESHPGGWMDGRDAAGQVNGVTLGSAGNDRIEQVELQWGDEGIDYNFGELLPASIAGRVHLTDADGNCDGPAAESLGIADVLVKLLDSQGATVAETRTDANGDYEFAGLLPGTYTIVEQTPAGLIDGAEHVGLVGQQAVGRIGGNDTITEIAIFSGEQALQYDFCEHQPSSLAGNVYHDVNDNGVLEPGESGIGGVEVELLDAKGIRVAVVSTAPDGAYRFENLRAGSYKVVEYHPAGWHDGRDTLGTIQGQVVGNGGHDQFSQVALRWGEDGVEYNFGEYQLSSIAGSVHADLNGNCIIEPGEVLLAGVSMELLDPNGNVLATTQTNSDGAYRFDDLTPGTYSVRQTQPGGYFHGDQHAGTGGGDDAAANVVAEISVLSGVALVGYDFCEVPPAKLSGFVFQDGEPLVTEDGLAPANLPSLRDGQFTPDDTPIAEVVLELRDGRTGLAIDASHALPGVYPSGPIRTTSNSDGFYEFQGLLGGREYAVYQIHPAGYVDSIDTPGTTSGQAFNVGQPINQGTLLQLAEPPRNDAIVRIHLDIGGVSENNNFSEVLVEVEPPPPPAPEPFFPRSIATVPVPPPTLPPLVQTPLVPVSLRTSLPNIVGGTLAGSMANTWHLSVINGGQPRDLASAQSGNVVWRQASYLNNSNWQATHLREAQWTLMLGERADQEDEVRQYTFGVRGGMPVTGDFNGDGLDELAVYFQGEWFIDLNGNGIWDEEDLWAKLGGPDDLPVTGDWDGDGKDDIGVYGPEWAGDTRAIEAEPGLPDAQNLLSRAPKNLPPKHTEATDGQRLLQRNQSGPRRVDVIDHVFRFGAGEDVPVTGDWNGDGIRSIGIFRDGTWQLDLDGDGRWTRRDATFEFGQSGDLPLVGDFNGDGVDELGVYRAGKWLIDSNGNRELEAHDRIFELGGVADHPVVGDWDGNGVDQPGLYREGLPEAPSETPVSQ